MEERGRAGMVAREGHSKRAAIHRRLEATVSLSDVLAAGVRFDAAAFNVRARAALSSLKATGHRLDPLLGKDGVFEWCSAPIRMKRIYVDVTHGAPLLSSSEIISLNPEPKGFVSRKLTKKLKEITIKSGELLISRSGTVGNIGIAAPSLAGWALSEDVLRLTSSESYIVGYAAAFLRSAFGRVQLATGKYGSVITHIEPSHLTNVVVPRLPKDVERDIGTRMMEACARRDQANANLAQSQKDLQAALGLPDIESLRRKSSRRYNTVSFSKLQSRFEGSYHNGLALEIEEALSELPGGAASIASDPFNADVRAVTKFRKRVYVPSGGIPLLSSKQLFQIDPIDVKRLAKGAHTKDLKEIALDANMLIVTCSGTIGRVQIVPQYMQGWCANQHANRIVCKSKEMAGYLFAWLSSDFGQALLLRQAYGSVILELDKEMLRSTLAPVPGDSALEQIGRLVLKANMLRDDAWRLEREAFAILDSHLLPEASNVAQGTVVAACRTKKARD